MMPERNRESVGVIVPVYNVEDYLEDCLDSIANQTVKFEEVILVNDGSKDASQSICEEYCKKFNYFKLINQENQGQAVARNNGLNHIKSKYIMFVDSDDFITLDANEIIKRQLTQKSLDILFFSSNVQFDIEVENKRNEYIRPSRLCDMVMSGMDFLKESFPTYYIVSPCLAVYRREFLQENGILFPAGHYYEDNFFALQCMYHARFVICVQNQLYIRRYRENSTMTSEITSKKIEDYVVVYKMMWQYIAEAIRPGNLDFWKGYISYGVLRSFDMIEKCPDIDVRTRYEKQLIFYFYQYCEPLIADKYPTIEVYCIFLKIYTSILKIGLFLFDSIETLPKKEEKLQKRRIDLKEKIRKIIDYKLRKILFGNSDQTIVFYGIGEHTKYLLKYIQEYHGTIVGRFYFGVTDKGELRFVDEKMKNVNLWEKDVDVFVVSSMIYQNEMKETLNRYEINDERVVLLYDETSVFDLVRIVPIILEP